MKLSIEQLYTLIRQYYKKYESRTVEPNITVGTLRPYSKLLGTCAVCFEISEEMVNSLGEKVTVRENIGDNIENIVLTTLGDMGYEVTGIEYAGVPGQTVSFAGLEIECHEKTKEDRKSM